MSARKTADRLVRLYPRSWRDRYGEELCDVILQSSGDQVPWHLRFDVLRASGRERLCATGMAGDGPPADRARGGVLAVLLAWALFVVAGSAVQKTSEHWQALPATGGRGLAQAAFVVLVAVAVAAAIVVLGGIAAAVVGVRAVNWDAVRRAVLSAAVLTVVAGAATVALVFWAHGLSAAARDGHDAEYGIAFVVWAVLCAAALLAWTVAAASIARRLELGARLLRVEVCLAVAVAAAMALMTVATAVWWASLGGEVSPIPLVGASALMVLATSLAGHGSRRAVHALAAIH